MMGCCWDDGCVVGVLETVVDNFLSLIIGSKLLFFSKERMSNRY